METAAHLLVIGAQKSGTTWLQHVLDADRSFWLPPQVQEVHFFDRDYDKGVNHYRGLYAPAPADKITCDVTPAYLHTPEVAARIRQSESALERPLRFAAILREPVSRAVSAYRMRLRKGTTSRSLREEVDALPKLVDVGLYRRNLDRYLEHFDRDQLLVLLFEELFGDAHDPLGTLAGFLGLAHPIENNYDGVRVNRGGTRRHPAADKVLTYGGRVLRGLGWTPVLHRLKRSKAVSGLRKTDAEDFRLSDDDQLFLEELKERFRDDVGSLSALIDRPDLPRVWGYA